MQQSIYIFDLDGTLSDATHRLDILNSDKTNKWDLFYEASAYDKPKTNIIEIFNLLIQNQSDVRIFTGRSESVADITLDWLSKHTYFTDISKLYMRGIGNHTEDHLLKKKWLYKYLSDQERAKIKLIFEDRKRVVDMYRSEGFTCLQVDSGEF